MGIPFDQIIEKFLIVELDAIESEPSLIFEHWISKDRALELVFGIK